MSRVDEINEAADKEFPNWEDHNIGFVQGAHWADEHPAPNLVDIDKVCEAFCKCECCSNCGEHKSNCTILGDFKQAIKGE